MNFFVKRLLPLGIMGILLGFLSGEGLLAGFVEGQLIKSIKHQARVAEDIKLDLGSLSLFDLFRGEIRGLKFSASRLAFQRGPVFEDLLFDSKGIQLDAKALWFNRELLIENLATTVLSLRLSEQELSAAMKNDLPEWEPAIKINPEGVLIEGSVSLLGKEKIPFTATALLEQASGDSIRIIPTGLKVGGIKLLTGVFQSYRSRLTWEYPIEMPWPLRMVDFSLNDGYLEIKWREY